MITLHGPGSSETAVVKTELEHAPPDVKGGNPKLARNTVLNLIGQVAPMFVAVISIPLVVHGLGSERFGILSIAWLILGYFGFLDLGLGRAATKFISEALARGELSKLPLLVWTCAGLQAMLGAAGGIALATTVPFLVVRVPNIPPPLMVETRQTLFLLAVSLPFVLATNGFRAVLEAAQRFDLVNYLRIPASSSLYLLPLLGLYLGFHLPGIVLLLTFARIFFCLAHLVCCFVAIPSLPLRPSWGQGVLLPLLRYGGWITVANLLNPFLLYLDRFMVGTFLSLSLLGFYTVPLEAVGRLLVVPASLVATLFPVFSGIGAVHDSSLIAKLYSRSFKYLVLILGPFIFFIAAFSHDILVLWMGPAFANQTGSVLRILAYGTLFNSFAYIPFGFLQSTGRPQLAAKILIIEIPLYLPMSWFLVTRFGILGAAIGWALRVAIEALVFMAIMLKVCRLDVRQFLGHGLLQSLGATAILGGALLVWNLSAETSSLWLRFSGAVTLLGGFGWLVWGRILDAPDRQQLFGLLPEWLRSSRAAVALPGN